jgi:NADPH:quinone reductase
VNSPLAPGRRVMVTELGEEPLERLEERTRLVPVAAPDPATLSPRDVIVAIRSAQVGWVDVLMTSGQYQHRPALPYTPGLEYAGVVAWAGPEARGVGVGDRVIVDGFAAGPRSSGAYQAYGGFASYGVAPAEAIIPIPGGLDFDQACSLLGNYETAYHCLITRGRLAAGETVLIHGASGATGLAAVHLARLCGATVIATGRSAAKLAVVAAEGAHHVLASVGFRDPVKQLTGGRGADVVYDGVGGEVTLESLRCMRFGARLLIVGWAATPLVAHGKGAGGAPRANQLPTNLIMMKGLDVLGCPTVISTVEQPALRPPRLAAILAWAEAGRIRPHVSARFALDDYAAALRAKWHGEVTGACVLHP